MPRTKMQSQFRTPDEEDKLKYRFGTSGQDREMTIINESGLYSLILTSKRSGSAWGTL